MNKEIKDIYWEGKIYIGVPDGESRYNYPSFTVVGEHCFKDGKNIIKGKDYEIKESWYSDVNSWSNNTVAVPIPVPEPVKEVNGAEEKFTEDDLDSCWTYCKSYFVDVLNGDYDLQAAREDLRGLIGSEYDKRIFKQIQSI